MCRLRTFSRVFRVPRPSGKEFWVLASQNNRMVVVRELGWTRGFFQALQELLVQVARVEPKIVRSPTIQAVLVAVVSNPVSCTSGASAFLMDLDKKGCCDEGVKVHHKIGHDFEPELIELLEKNRRLRLYPGSCALSLSPLQVVLIAEHYRTLKNTGILKACEKG